ncbi:MAG: MFS transporter, partial [Verrucomicrobium sp.]
AWLYVGRIIAGITASNFSAASAYIADITPPEKRAEAFGIIGAAFGLGFVAGPLVGGWLGDVGLRVPFLVAAGITLLNCLYGLFVLPESVDPKNRRPFHWASVHPIRSLMALRRWPMVVGLAETHFCIHLAQNIYPSLWVLYTGTRYGWDSRHVGASLAIVGILMAVVQGGLAGRIIGALGEKKGLALGMLATTVAMAGYGLAPYGWMVYALLTVGALGGIAGPAAQAMITREVGADEQGAVQGALNSITSVAGIAGPLIWTWLFAVGIGADSQGRFPGLAFIGAAAVTLLGLVMAWRAMGNHKDPLDKDWGAKSVEQ